jgi:dihydropyrimidine dehydrogenase (NAD+) subunit PreA
LKHIEANPISAYGGGEAIRVINHYYTACASMFFPNVDVWSGGGITTGEHLVESIMLGAKAAQAAGAVMFHGISQIRRMIKFLENYMERCGYKTIEDFRGLATKYVKPWDDALVEQIRGVAVAAQVDETKCSGCRTCTESLCPAIQMEDNLAVVNEDNCSACGLCLMICPEGAINMASSEKTLGERIDQGPDFTFM